MAGLETFVFEKTEEQGYKVGSVHNNITTEHANGGSARMTKSELVARIAEMNPQLYQRDVERIVSTIFEEITTALSRGDRVELRGFGAFSVKERNARVGRNPRTGAAVEVDAKAVPFFKTGKQLRDLINDRTA